MAGKGILRCFYTVLFMGIFTGAVLFVSPSSHALEGTIPKITEYKGPSETELEQMTKVVQFTPQQNKILSYELRIPKDWLQNDIVASNRGSVNTLLLSELNLYSSPPSMDGISQLSVSAIELEHKISAELWLTRHLQNQSVHAQGFTTHAPTFAEALHVKVERDTSYIIRTQARINGKMLVLLSYATPDSLWMKERGLQASILNSFAFLNPENEQGEQTKNFSFLKRAQIDYPASWRMQAPQIDNIDHMSINLIRYLNEETLQGEIGVHLWTKEVEVDIAQEVRNLRQRLENNRRLKLGSVLPIKDPFQFSDDIQAGVVEAYKVSDHKGVLVDYEYWFGILKSENYIAMITLLTPSRQDDVYTWSRNVESYRIVVRSLKN